MLIESTRHTAEDLTWWDQCERADAVHARSATMRRRIDEAARAVAAFAAGGPCYAGVSWGKDSVVLAHLVALHAPHVPLVWVRVEPISNPDCVIVRDAFLAAHAVTYDEIETRCDGPRPRRVLESGFAAAVKRYGPRRLSGIRGAESGSRSMRMRTHGVATERTCAPIGWWSTAEVFAYLYMHGLPVHPAYACTRGGLFDRERLRVASIGGQRGTGHGRAEWERIYYPTKIDRPPLILSCAGERGQGRGLGRGLGRDQGGGGE